MNIIIERVISQTINKFINENCSRSSVITENDGDDMGIYKELDDKVIDICYRHDFNVQTRVGNDLAYYAFFIADDRLPPFLLTTDVHLIALYSTIKCLCIALRIEQTYLLKHIPSRSLSHLNVRCKLI